MNGTTGADPATQAAGAATGGLPRGAGGQPGAGVAMSARTRTGLAVLGAAGVAGVAGDALLRAVPWGINLTLWVLLLCALTTWLRRRDPAAGVPGTEWLPWVAALALLAAWRDSPTLRVLDLAALAVVVGLAVYRAQGGSIALGGVGGYVLGTVRGWGEAAVGSALLLGRDVRWGEIPRNGLARHAGAAARGLAIALPLLLVFGALLAAADAVFQGLLARAFRLDVPLLLTHVWMVVVLAWAAGGTLRALVLSTGQEAPRVPRPAGFGLGAVETATVLGSLDLLFAAFVAVQVRYFFGGAEVVTLAGSTLSYAEYARRGFFELVTVSALVLPLLLMMHWLLRPGDARAERLFRWLAGAQVALLGIIMASALRRMWLLQEAYGLTELRLYSTAFMVWLAVVFAWFAATVLRGRRERFALGALASAVLGVGALHAASPDAMIVRANVEHAAGRPERFDAAYAASLAGDAVPELLAVFPKLGREQRCVAAQGLLSRWAPVPGEGEDWRSWSWSRGRALNAVAAREKELRAACPEAAGVRRGDVPPAEEGVTVLLPGETIEAATARLEAEAAATGAAAAPPAAAPVPAPAPAVAPVEAAAYALPNTGATITIERHPVQPAGAGAEQRRTLLLSVDGVVADRVEMAAVSGARSRAELFQADDSTYVVRDLVASYTLRTGRYALWQDAERQTAPGRLVGAFDVEAGEGWRFVPAPASARAETRDAPRRR